MPAIQQPRELPDTPLAARCDAWRPGAHGLDRRILIDPHTTLHSTYHTDAGPYLSPCVAIKPASMLITLHSRTVKPTPVNPPTVDTPFRKVLVSDQTRRKGQRPHAAVTHEHDVSTPCAVSFSSHHALRRLQTPCTHVCGNPHQPHQFPIQLDSSRLTMHTYPVSRSNPHPSQCGNDVQSSIRHPGPPPPPLYSTFVSGR